MNKEIFSSFYEDVYAIIHTFGYKVKLFMNVE